MAIVNKSVLAEKASQASARIARNMYSGNETMNTLFAGILRAATAYVDDGEPADEKSELNRRIKSWSDDIDSLRNDFCAKLPRNIDTRKEAKTLDSFWDELAGNSTVKVLMMLELMLKNFRTPEIDEILKNTKDARNSRPAASEKKETPAEKPKKDMDPVSRKEKTGRTEQLLVLNGESRANLLEIMDDQTDAVNLFFNTLCENDLRNIASEEKTSPRAVFSFIGGPNIGKTYMARVAAKEMRALYLQLDMTQFSTSNSLERMVGSAANKNGILSAFLSKKRKSVIVVENMHKASKSVQSMFEEIITTGSYKSGLTELTFEDCVIIFCVDVTDAEISFATNYESTNAMAEYNSLRTNGLPASVIEDKTNLPVFFSLLYNGFPASVLNNSTLVFFENPSVTTMEKVCRASIQKAIDEVGKAFDFEVEVDEKVITAFLYSQPDLEDAEAVGENAKKFVNSEILKLLACYEPVSSFNTISQNKKLKFWVDLKDESTEIQDLFIQRERIGILFVGLVNGIDKRLKKALENFNLYEADDAEEAKKLLNSKSIDLIVMQIDSDIPIVAGDPEEDEIQDIRQRPKEEEEDYNNEGTIMMFDKTPIGATALVNRRKDLRAIAAEFPEIPLYITESDFFTLDQELKNALIAEGAKGFLPMETSYTEISSFVKKLKNMGKTLYVRNKMKSLKQRNKVVKFESVPYVDRKENIVTIRLKNFSLEQFVSRNDSEVDVEAADHISVRLKDVIGAKSAKEELRTFLDYLKNPKRYIAAGMRAPRGVLLYGNPGTGKTMLAKALAGEANVAFLALEGSSVIGRYVGDEQKVIKELFAKARKYAPAIIFIDEIDTIGKARSGADNTMARVEEQALTTLLSEMDGAKTDPKHPVFVIAATNYGVEAGKSPMGVLDGALLRRFDRTIKVELPDSEGRLQFLEKKTANTDASEKVFAIDDETLEQIAKRTAGSSLADLDNVIESAKRKALRKDTVVTDEILNDALDEILHGEKVTWGVDIMKRIAYHEAGHVVAAVKEGDTPSYVSITSRGNDGGFTITGDNAVIETKDSLLGRIRTGLGGRAAEIVHYGAKAVSNGCSDDLRVVNRIAKDIVCNFGMDDDFGLFVYSEEELKNPAYAADIHKKVVEILNEQMKAVTAELEKESRLLDEIAEALLDKNQLNGEEIEKLVRRYGA